MTTLNQFESIFKAADKAVFAYEPLSFERVLLVTDMLPGDTETLVNQTRPFLATIDGPNTRWEVLGGNAFDSVQALLDRIESARPDLIVTYRHLHSNAWNWPHSLGEYLDVMTQATANPILVLPHPAADRSLPHSVQNTNNVMAITNHLTGDSRLVNAALAFTAARGTCCLTHVESVAVYERYMDAITKIPAIETEIARETIATQLLKEPHDFIAQCRGVIEDQGLPLRVEEIVIMGRRIAEYKTLIEERKVDLLVLHTKDEDQLAMHGQAYPLAVEVRGIPLLML